MARHFSNIHLENYIPNNWLKQHGIPTKRRVHHIRQFIKRINKEGPPPYDFSSNYQSTIDKRKEAIQEKQAILDADRKKQVK